MIETLMYRDGFIAYSKAYPSIRFCGETRAEAMTGLKEMIQEIQARCLNSEREGLELCLSEALITLLMDECIIQKQPIGVVVEKLLCSLLSNEVVEV